MKEKKIILYDRETGEEISFNSRFSIMKSIYSPISCAYDHYSPMINDLIEKYKDNEVVPHVLTSYEQKRLAENPDFINDIPRGDIKGYDKAISHELFERRLKEEFYSLFCNADERIIKCINRHHKDYKAIIKEVKTHV